jgi:23S rRNA pseudouridine2605 synthase
MIITRGIIFLNICLRRKKMERVQKLLSSYGFCSRRKAEELIKQGRVRVNNKEISIGDSASETDRIFVDGKEVVKQKRVYLMLNKPFGCVTALTDPRYRTVMSYIHIKERVFPVGRLDFNTEGLLLFTNDGDFADKIMHPRHEISKSYLVWINRPLRERDRRQIEKGINLEDGRTSSARITRHETFLVEIEVHEGKKRIVRRLFQSFGYSVRRLVRVRIGHLYLGNLEPGRFRILRGNETKKIFLP